MKRVLLVNGVPASGKSTVARAIAQANGWPLLGLDTIKEAFFGHLGTGDRDYNRKLGKAAYQAIFALIKGFPSESTTVVDAWFGFQPFEVLHGYIEEAKIDMVAEIWCHVTPEIIGERYTARLGQRHCGHLGASYVPELIELAAKARPIGIYPLFDANTVRPLDLSAVDSWLGAAFRT